MVSPLGQPVATSPRDFRARLVQAPRPLTFFRGNLLSPLGSPVAPFPRDFEPGSPTGKMFPREFGFTARPTGCHFSEGFSSPALPGSPTGWILLPREFAFAARPNGDHFSEGSLSTAPPGFPTGKTFPRESAFLARPPGRHFSEGFEPGSPTG